MDQSTKQNMTSKRRRFLKLVGVSGMVGVAGCMGGDDDDGEADGNGDDGNGDDGNGEDDPEPAEFAVNDLQPNETGIGPGDASLSISASITNEGEEEGTQTIEYRIEDDVLTDEELTISGSEMENFSAQVDLQDLELEPGEYTHGVYSDDDEETGTLTYENPELEDSLLTLDPALLGEGEEMITGVFENSEGFTLQNGSAELSASDGAEIVDSDGDSFDILGGNESQDVVWHLDIEEGTEQVEITAIVSYETDWDEAEFEVTNTYTVVGAPEVPYGLNLGGYFDEDTNQVVGDQVADDDGVLFYPLREDGETPEGVELLNEHNETQHAGPVTDPIFPQSISGTGIWNAELGYAMDVEPGTYQVTFTTHETTDASPGFRIFDVYMQGELVSEALDINAELEEEYGDDFGTGIQYHEVHEVEVEEGEPLTVEAIASEDNSFLTAIEIREA